MIGDGWLFASTSKKRVTAEEYKRARSRMHAKDLTELELNKVDELFQASLYEQRDEDKGIDEKEIDSTISWMRAHMHEHNIPDHKITIIESCLKEFL